MMKAHRIGVIGAGAIGLAFAQKAAAAGYEVMISNRRGPESLPDIIPENSTLKAGTTQQAAQADIVMLALPWKHMPEAVRGLPDMAGKIILDPMNPVIMPGFILPDLGNRTSSEIVADHLPGARIVKVFNTLPPSLITADARQMGGNRVVFFSGDDQQAKSAVAVLLEDMGFSGVDLGGLVEGGRLQHFPGGPLASLHLVKY